MVDVRGGGVRSTRHLPHASRLYDSYSTASCVTLPLPHASRLYDSSNSDSIVLECLMRHASSVNICSIYAHVSCFMSQRRASAYSRTYPHACTYRIRIACVSHTCTQAQGGCAQGVVLKAWYMAGPGCEQVELRLVCLLQNEVPFVSLSLSLSRIPFDSLSLSLSHSLCRMRCHAQRDVC